MYAPTAAGVVCERRVRAREKITSTRPAVAITSESRCAGEARWCVEIVIGAESEHAVGRDGAEHAAGALRRNVGERVAPGQATERGVGERHDRVEVPARDGSEHEDDREQPRGGGGGVLEQLEAGVARGECLRCDARADHERREERRAQQLGKQAASERRRVHRPDRITSTDVSVIDISRSMPVDLELSPKQKRANGSPCCEPVVYPDVQRDHALRMAEVAKALGDPIRLQLVDVLRKHAGKVCVCELVPLFDISQSTLSHHLGKLRAAGIVDSERKGLWAYYYVIPDALEELSAWLS